MDWDVGLPFAFAFRRAVEGSNRGDRGKHSVGPSSQDDSDGGDDIQQVSKTAFEINSIRFF